MSSPFRVQALAFAAVTLQRACHNSLIEWAKGEAQIAEHTVSSVIFVSQASCVIIGWLLAAHTGGREALSECFNAGTLKKFAWIGVLYAFGSIFEMTTVNYVDSATYTVVSQSKLLVTAILMWRYDGTRQSPLQWLLLLTISSGVVEFVLAGRGTGGLTFSPLGVALNLAKVIISCNVAVLNTKAMKTDKNSFPVQFACLKLSWAGASLLYMIVKDGLLSNGTMFGTWTSRTWVLVFAGFVMNTICNQFLLKVLASALAKNLSEAIGVPLVYFARVLFMDGVFQSDVLNAAIIVILGCTSYILSKSEASASKTVKSPTDFTAAEEGRLALLKGA